MAATAAAAICLFNPNTTAAHSPTDSSRSQCLTFHAPSSWRPRMPFTSITALRLHASTSTKLCCLLQETAIEEEGKEKDIVEPDSKQEESPPLACTTWLYVCNLPFGCDAAQVRMLFEGCGKVISVELMRDKETGRSRGFAFVRMGTVEEARTAIERYDGYEVELDGRVVSVRFPKRAIPDRRSGDPDLDNYIESPNRIYCGNLAWTVTSRSLREFFNIHGNVLGAKVIYDRQTGSSMGYGFVSFASEGDVNDAIAALNGKDLEGRPVQLESVKRAKKPATKKNSATEENSIPQEIVKE